MPVHMGSVAQLRRAPVTKTGSWGFKSLLIPSLIGQSLVGKQRVSKTRGLTWRLAMVQLVV